MTASNLTFAADIVSLFVCINKKINRLIKVYILKTLYSSVFFLITTQGGESSIAWWRNVQVAKRLGGKSSRWQNVQGAKRPGGETSWGEMSRGRNVHKSSKVVVCYLLNKRLAPFTIVPYCQQIAKHSVPLIPQSICGRIPHSAKYSYPPLIVHVIMSL